MSYKPDEGILMAYVYGELVDTEREKVERYLFENPEAKKELDKLQQVRHIMGMVRDKEVIAPPIVMDGHTSRFNWNSPYLKTVFAIAASLLLIMVIGSVTKTNISFADRELKISFGKGQADDQPIEMPAGLTTRDVQDMINNSLSKNNEALEADWNETQEKFDASIRLNLTQNSNKIDNLVKQASIASQDQIKAYLSTAQADNMRQVKDYFQLTSGEQKKYIEDLLVDFAQYLQQQRTDDLKIVQSRLNNIEQNTDLFKQETEQILTSIISNTNSNAMMNKN